jgi:hypothetical protein
MRSLFAHFALFCAAFLTLTFALPNKDPWTLGHKQLQTTSLWNNIIPGTFSIHLNTKYSSIFRPPSPVGEELEDGPDPTVVDISLNSIKVTTLNESSGRLLFTANLIKEYKDPRLAFDPPINDRTFKYVRTPKSYSVSLWNPNLRFEDVVSATYDFGAFSGHTDQSFVNPEGRVLIKSRVKIELQSGAMEYNAREMDFSMKIIGDFDTVEDVQFRWRHQNPLTFHENNEEVTGEYGSYSIEPILDKCRKIEDLGSFVGQREYTCLKMGLKAVLEEETTVMMEIPRFPLQAN